MTTSARGMVSKFTLQLELLFEEEWVPVVRYDSAHDEAHIDYINPKGKTYNKIWLNLTAPFNDAFTLAENELKSTFKEHRARFTHQMGEMHS